MEAANEAPRKQTLRNWRAQDWVEHALFGIGQVSESREDKLDIDFVTNGRKTLLKSTELKSAASPSPTFKFAHQKRKTRQPNIKEKGPAKRHSLDFDDLTSCFKGRFAEGFEGQDFHLAERESKEKAAAVLKDKLGKDAFDALLHDRRYSEVGAIAKQILQSTNLVHPMEKAKFTNAIEDVANEERLANGLFDVLHGATEMEKRFTNFCDLLSEMGVNTWTIATYYQFLATDGKWMFMKPTIMKIMGDSLKISLNYKPTPNWFTYSKLQELASRVDSELRVRGLIPRSMVDVQGFIWSSIQIEDGKYGKG